MNEETTELVKVAVKDESLRERAVYELCREMEHNKFAEWHYAESAEDLAQKYVDLGIKQNRIRRVGEPPGRVAFDVTGTVLTKEDFLKQFEAEGVDSWTAVTRQQDDVVVGPQKIYSFALPRMFTNAASKGDNVVPYVRSIVRHEGTHSKDYHKGVDFGNGIRIDDTEKLLAYTMVGVMFPLIELRGFAESVRLERAEMGDRTFEDSLGGLHYMARQCRNFIAGSPYGLINGIPIKAGIRRQLETYAADPLLSTRPAGILE